MRHLFLAFLAMAILAFTSCQKETEKAVPGSDTELIAAIKKATNKKSIAVGELPDPLHTVLKKDYAGHFVDMAKFAPGLGYEVDLRFGQGPLVGESDQAYFDLRGRELRAGNDGKGDKDFKKRLCFELVYPVTFIMPDGTGITIDSKDDQEGWGEIKAWYAAHPDVKEKPGLSFPVEIQYRDGTVVTINSKEEMRDALADCKEDNGNGQHKRICFELVLPVTYIMPDGSEITIEDKEDRLLIKEWYTQHPDVQAKPELQYPVDIKYKDGTVATINDKEEMIAAKKECREKEGKGRCFELVLPVTYTMPDGSEITIEVKEDRQLIREWYAQHPDVNAKPALQYPVDIKYKDGTVVTISNVEEMKQAREDCRKEENKQASHINDQPPASNTSPDNYWKTFWTAKENTDNC